MTGSRADAHRETKTASSTSPRPSCSTGRSCPSRPTGRRWFLSAKSYADRIDPVTDHEHQVDGVALHNLTLAYGVDCVIDG